MSEAFQPIPLISIISWVLFTQDDYSYAKFETRQDDFLALIKRSHCNSQPIPVQSRTKFRCSSAIPFAHAHFLPSMVSPSLHATAAERPGKAFPKEEKKDDDSLNVGASGNKKPLSTLKKD
ncbi:hypothetical protein P5673_004751 [Acropora cervicornis]|uniref:Uncharacterized protein n=1 Tax=Acropora cervicornis TaxID=6130 RepID=A0AAD9VDJ6_ACRCE|nr:hypothetical protein P5673_004751 [Acropora cervicornis]